MMIRCSLQKEAISRFPRSICQFRCIWTAYLSCLQTKRFQKLQLVNKLENYFVYIEVISYLHKPVCFLKFFLILCNHSCCLSLKPKRTFIKIKVTKYYHHYLSSLNSIWWKVIAHILLDLRQSDRHTRSYSIPFWWEKLYEIKRSTCWIFRSQSKISI